MHKHYRSARSLDNEVKVSVVNVHEDRFGERVIMRHARSDVSLFESTGNSHDRAFWETDTLDGGVRALVT